MTAALGGELRRLLARAVAGRVTPGAVVEVGSADGALAVEAVGRLTYADDAPAVDAGTLYDLASLTKVMATATLAMRPRGRRHAAARHPGRGGAPRVLR